MKIVKTDSNNPDFITLVKLLDAYLAEIDGEEHAFYAQYNTVNTIKHVIVLYENDKPVACGAIKEFSANTMEIKRMFTLPEYRGKGYASAILKNLEEWVKELDYKKCVLETGKKQKDAVYLYQKMGYTVIPNYGQYLNVENSICFEKKMLHSTL